MKPLNIAGFKSLAEQDYLVVDTRQPEVFCEGFITGSVSIPMDENFIATFHELIEDEQKVLLISAESEITTTASSLKYAGISTIGGFLEGGFETWKTAGEKIDMLIPIGVDEFAIDFKYDEFYLVDIRSVEEFEKEHIEDAQNIPLVEIEKISLKLEANGNYYLYSEVFAEVVTAGALLKRNGFERVRVVSTTYNALKENGLPLFIQKKTETLSKKFLNN